MSKWQPDRHGVDKEEVEDEVEQGVGLPHRQGDLQLQEELQWMLMSVIFVFRYSWNLESDPQGT